MNGFINFEELSGPISFSVDGVVSLIGDVDADDFDYDNFSYAISDGEIDISAYSLDLARFSTTDTVVEFYSFTDSSGEYLYFTPSYLSLNVTGQQTQSAIPDGGGGSVSTPEPTLTLGFITLGGLMLGSKRKRKG